MSLEARNPNPRLADILTMLRDVVGAEIRVALPGRITKYDSSKHCADVQVSIMGRDQDGRSVRAPIIPKVPIVFPRSTAGALVLPLVPGDVVTLLFSDRSLDSWKLSSGKQDVFPNNALRHALPDCWAFPGGYPLGSTYAGTGGPGKVALYVAPGTKLVVGNDVVAVAGGAGPVKAELLAILDKFMELVATSTCPLNQPLTRAADILALKELVLSLLKD